MQSTIRNRLSSIAAAVAMSLAFAAPAVVKADSLAGGVVVIGGIQVTAGAINGSASSITTGSATTAAQSMGSGWSNQHADGLTTGTATIGGILTPTGATVITGTTQVSDSNVRGTVGGNAPIQDGAGAYLNAGATFGKVENKAIGGATFGTGAILAVAGIAGAAAIGPVPGL